MKTFAAKEKLSAPTTLKLHPYVHYSMGLVQQAQRAEIRRILRATGAQAKLTTGQSNVKYEQEADRVADEVVRMRDADVAQRQPENDEEDETLQTKPLADQITPMVQRQKHPEGEEAPVQAKGSKESSPTITPTVENGINSIRGGGQPLSESSRTFFETCFGTDFRSVRVHSDSRAADLSKSKSINAKAFTLGRDVVFGTGQYAPETSGGKQLLAHELTHVVQQGRGKILDKSVGIQAKNNGEQLSDIKNVIIIGSPSKDQRTELQFVYAAMMKGGDKNTIWLVEQTGHNKKQKEFIEKNKPGKLLWFRSTPNLISHIKKMKNSSIGELTVFSHGTPSVVHLRYNHKKLRNYGFNLKNVRLLQATKSKFINDAIISFDSCRAGAGKKKAMKNSLAQRISDVIGIPIKAWLGRTSYRLTNECYKEKLKGKDCKVVGSQYSGWYRWLGIATKDDEKERKARSKGHEPRELKFYPKKFMVTIVDKSPLINNPVYLHKNKGKFKRYKWLEKGRVIEVLSKKFCNKWKKLTSKVGCWWTVLTTNFALGTKLPNMKKIKGWLLKDHLKKIEPQDVK